MASVLAGAPFERFTLTYSVPGASSGTDAFGNPTTSTTTGTVTAFIGPVSDALQYLPGSDASVMRVKGELVSPLAFPASVGVGSVLTLTFNGRASTLTLTRVFPNDLIGVAFGASFTGDVRSVS